MKALLLSSHTPSLFWFRVDLMKAMQDVGYEVVAAGQMPEADWSERFKSLGVRYRQIRVARNGLNPLSDLVTLKDIKKLLREERPDKIFAFQAKTISYGAMAANSLGITDFYPLIAGLGSVFRGKGLKNKLTRTVMSVLYKQAFKKSKKIFFQNNDDRKMLINAGLLKEEQIVMIHGSGVNLVKFQPTVFPEIPTFLFIGRLIKDKGVIEYLKACTRIKEMYTNMVRCLLVGPYDSNPSALKPEELQPLVDKGVIEYFGEQSNIQAFISQSTVYVLPSYHEGTPKTVLESMAMGRTIITTDAPGCRETVINGENGFLVPVKNVDVVITKMQYLIERPLECIRMGAKSREIATKIFDVNIVNKTILETMGMI